MAVLLDLINRTNIYIRDHSKSRATVSIQVLELIATYITRMLKVRGYLRIIKLD